MWGVCMYVFVCHNLYNLRVILNNLYNNIWVITNNLYIFDNNQQSLQFMGENQQSVKSMGDKQQSVGLQCKNDNQRSVQFLCECVCVCVWGDTLGSQSVQSISDT